MRTYNDTRDHTPRSSDAHSDKDSQDRVRRGLIDVNDDRRCRPHTTYRSEQGLRIVVQVFRAELQPA
jgi:hypothetical protein